MIKKLVFVLLVGIGFMSCGGGENEKMQMAIDSLTNALEENLEVAATLQEVGIMMDSIDANRQSLKLGMLEGTSYNDYKARMTDINDYVKDSQKKIQDLENALKKSRGTSNAFSSTIKKLKSDLEARNKEAKIIQKEQELALIEARIQELMIQSKMSEGDAYFARGEAIEEAANRTRLAPRKKKETYQEALEMYKKALSLGVAKAQGKIAEMEEKVN